MEIKVKKIHGKKNGFDFEKYTHWEIRQGKKTLGSFDDKETAQSLKEVMQNALKKGVKF
ncbi:MAG: hypothetical protein PHD04_05280 [Candidatus Pacebacteria bacterium]|nr:hypothetical protein [Candidatus Paceibacterota bacterium]